MTFLFSFPGGTSRYPLGEDCGYFTLKQEKDCSSKSRSRRSVPTQSMTLTHGEALHLCTSMQNLPDDTPFQINYIPIKINLTPQMTSLHLSEECVKWVYKSCGKLTSQHAVCSVFNFHVRYIISIEYI